MTLNKKIYIMTPANACVVLRGYVARINRLLADAYNRKNERTRDMKVARYETKVFTPLVSIAIHNKNKQDAIKLVNDAYGHKRLYESLIIKEN